MKIVDITKDTLISAQKEGFTVLITKFNSDPLNPTWIVDKVEASKKALSENYQLCYSLKEAILTIDNRPFIGKLQLSHS